MHPLHCCHSAAWHGANADRGYLGIGRRWRVWGSAYHPMNLLRVSIAAIGRVEESVDESSVVSPFALGS